MVERGGFFLNEEMKNTQREKNELVLEIGSGERSARRELNEEKS